MIKDLKIRRFRDAIYSGYGYDKMEGENTSYHYIDLGNIHIYWVTNKKVKANGRAEKEN